MPLIPREKIDDVRERTNLVEVVRRHVELKRAGTAQEGQPEPEESGHVTGRELCLAARQLALRHYGSLAMRVLAEWGIASTSDIGEIVYNMIDSGDLDKTPSDKRSDFDDVFDFATALQSTSLPSGGAAS